MFDFSWSAFVWQVFAIFYISIFFEHYLIIFVVRCTGGTCYAWASFITLTFLSLIKIVFYFVVNLYNYWLGSYFFFIYNEEKIWFFLNWKKKQNIWCFSFVKSRYYCPRSQCVFLITHYIHYFTINNVNATLLLIVISHVPSVSFEIWWISIPK